MPAKAQKQRADLFVSIHADAFTSRQPSGSSVFALSTKGATSTAAKYLAQTQNASDLIGGVSNSGLPLNRRRERRPHSPASRPISIKSRVNVDDVNR